MLRKLGYAPRGLITGTSVWFVGVAPRRWKLNAEVDQLSTCLTGARQEALKRLATAARNRGGSIVAGVELKIETFEPGTEHHRVVVTALGTAFSTPAGQRQEIVTTALSGRDLYLLVEAGYQPAGLMIGSCVYHVGHQAFTRWAASQTQNVEMTTYTEALYAARELAMSRMQANAERAHATGIVGVTVTQRAHIWGSRVIEFYAVGTGIRGDGNDNDHNDLNIGIPLDT